MKERVNIMVSGSKIKRVLNDPSILIPYLSSKLNLKWIPDKLLLKILFRARIGKRLNLEKPSTFNEKLQWLKIHDKNPMYTQLVDKYEVRKYIAEKIGDQYLIPLIGVYDTFNEIDFDSLPNQFVLKCTHDSGGVIICKDKSKLDRSLAERKINKHLKKNYYWLKREWPYKYVKPRIICEEYVEDKSSKELKDYKFFCFNGEPKVFFIASDRGTDTRFDFFDLNFNRLPLKNHYKNSDKKIEKPKNLDEMIKFSRILSDKIPHVRVDFYEVNGEVFFGELTFYHFSGFEKFEPEKYDRLFGSWLELPNHRK